MFKKPVQKIFKTFEGVGVDIFIAGGAVRDQLLKCPISDYDFAAACPPEESLRVLEAAGVRVVKTGFDFGTVTAVIDNHGYEITSFRQDVRTDGRHAEVVYGTDIEADAKRRDFTINALYIDARGQVIDPLGGIEDIHKKRLRFVGDADARVKEDYLRILRFYRFLSTYPLHADETAETACAEHAEGLQNISAERIGAEMKRLLQGESRATSLEKAAKTGVTHFLFENFNLGAFKAWVEYTNAFGIQPDWRVETLMATDQIPRENWAISRNDERFMSTLTAARDQHFPAKQMGEIYGQEIANWALQIRAFRSNQPLSKSEIAQIEAGAKLEFPVNGDDLLALGYSGKHLGDTLKTLKENWRNSDYTQDKNTLIEIAKSKLG